ncbi:MAG: hypothetical protein GXO65_03865 [Euryarchaeota archaeon]|nr:hypothetical protein [Euryarchaeota archaeon]
MDKIWAIRVVVDIVDISLLVVLVGLYIKRYEEVKSEFTMGFLLVAAALLIRTLFSAPFLRLVILHQEISTVIDPYRLVADFFELGALSVLLYISTR